MKRLLRRSWTRQLIAKFRRRKIQMMKRAKEKQ